MKKLQLLLASRSPETVPALIDLGLDQFDFVRAYPGATYRLALYDEIARSYLPDMGVPAFEVVIELGAETDAPLLERAEALRPALAKLIDSEQSVAVLGDEWQVVPGEGPIQLFRCMSRREDKTLEEFAEHWRTLHADLGRLTLGKTGYFQLHRDPQAQSAAAKAAGLGIDSVDGVAQLTFQDTDALTLLGSNQGLLKATSDDGALFVDRTKARGNFARVVALAGPIA